MRLSRTSVGSYDLTVSMAEAALDQDQFSSGQLCCWPRGPGTYHAILLIMAKRWSQMRENEERYPTLPNTPWIRMLAPRKNRGPILPEDSWEISLWIPAQEYYTKSCPT